MWIAYFLIAAGVIGMLTIASGMIMLAWNLFSGSNVITLWQTFSCLATIALCMLIAGVIK